MLSHKQTNKNSKYYSEYQRWKAMKRRCYYGKDKHFMDYGSRGIIVCERWKNSFENFINDMGKCPEKHSLDRIDNNGNYEPGNCKWSTSTEQAVNKRNVHWVVFNGSRIPAAHLAKINGIKRSTFSMRIKYGYSPLEAATKGVK